MSGTSHRERLDDVMDEVGSTTRQRPTGDKKNRGEGTSHWIAHSENNDQRTEQKSEKVPTKKNAEVLVRFQKNHSPEKAKKVLEVTENLRR